MIETKMGNCMYDCMYVGSLHTYVCTWYTAHT